MHARLRRGRAKGKRLALFSLQSVNKSVNRRDRKSPRNVGSTGFCMEQMMGIEPTQPAWKAGILTIELHPQTTFSILANKMQKVNIKL